MRTHTQSVVASVLSVPCVALCQVAESSDAPVSLEHATVVRLSVAPESERLMWSPKGATVELTTSADGTMRGQFKLGPKGSAPILVSLSKSRKSGHIDRLAIDFDRDGDLNDETVLTCEPKEQRGKIWSSFSAELPVPVSDPWGSDTSIPYRINLWYVFDPLEPDAPPQLRWSRRSFFTGTCMLDGVETFVMVCERDMDGVIDRDDAWALAPMDEKTLALGNSSRAIDDHAWLNTMAYNIAAVDASGLLAVIVPYDSLLTREQEEHQRDALAGDRAATRSGETVNFLHDFAQAQSIAREQKKLLFVDFETDWCGPCKQMDALVYTADNVVAAAKNVVAVKVDGDISRDLVKQFDIRGYPTMLLLDQHGKEMGRHVGYMGVTDTSAFLARAQQPVESN